jgi:putative tricarboxylic transport membrane protein
MDLVSHLAVGFSVALSPENLLYCFLGVLIGTAIGVLPGLGPMATMAMLLPITFNLDPAASLIMLAGIYYGAQYGGSTTAILINLPGESSAAVTTLDGYQMARRGRAGPALATAALGSFFAGCVATVLIAVVAIPLTRVALEFGPAEYFSLVLLGLVSSVVLASGSLPKAIAMILVGLLLGLVGSDLYTGVARFTLGFTELSDGINFTAVAVGFFGISEIFRNLQSEQSSKVEVFAIGSLWPSREDFRRMIGPVLRGTGIGSLLGALPGGMAVLAAFAAYTIEKSVSKNKSEFGKGAIEGVAAPESANNASAQTSFIPMLTLGIPSNPVMALMIGALIMQGIVPGPDMISQRPGLFWGLIASMWVGNALLVVLNLPLVGLWVKLLRVPYNALIPVIIVFCSVGVYSIASAPLDLWLVAIFGLSGYLLIKLDFEPAPLLLGFVLGPLLEEHFRRAMILSQGDLAIFIEEPVSAVLLFLAAIVLAAVTMPVIYRERTKVFVED